jgi:hypothetical protein
MPTPNSAPSAKDAPEAGPAAAQQHEEMTRGALGALYALEMQFGADVRALFESHLQVEAVEADDMFDNNGPEQLAA